MARLAPALLGSLLVGSLFLFGPAASAGAEKDAERQAHSDEASTPQKSFEERVGDVLLRQYQLGCLSQLTYLVVSRGEAAVVDPQRDVEHYLRDAESLGAKVVAVVLTHTNADFVAGHTELAERTGAKVYISAESGSEFPHQGLEDRQRVPLGAATLEFWATPGHTLDSMTVLVRAPGAAADPAWALTGDTLFIGGIGRPDLVGGETTPVVLAGKAFASMARLRMLPDDTKVLPAHGAGSLCGAHLSPDTVSTIAREKATNPYLQPMSRAKFVSRVVTGLPAAPPYFRENVALNRRGPPVVEWTDALPVALEPAAAKERIAKGAWVVDLRDAKAYAAGHVEGSVNVAVRGRLDTWTGSVVPFDAPIVLVGTEDEVREAAFRFRRIGMDRVEGRLAGDPAAWAAGGLTVRTTRLVTPAELSEAMARGSEPFLVDVRTPEEYAEVRVGDYANLPLTDWETFGRVLDPKAPVLFLCNSAYRSSMAVGLAERQGFTDLASLDGGLDAWLTAGLPTLGTAKVAPSGAAAGPAVPAGTPAAEPLLPEPMEPAALAQALADQPSLYAVLDVRPEWAYREYHVLGAVRVPPASLVEHARRLKPGVRVVLVDRDGTTAYALGGTLLQALGDPTRSVRVLSGGTARFHREIELGANAGTGAGRPAAKPSPEPAAPTAPSVVPALPEAPKKRPAGC